MQERIFSFGAWVRERRMTLRLTQRKLAERAACSAVLIAKIERDERRPSQETAAVLAKALGIPPDQQERFVRVARGMIAPDHLPAPDSSAPPIHHAPPPPPGNLPIPPDRFVGRSAELATLTTLFARPHVRLITLVGPGGSGKTRLALEAARAVQSNYTDGAWFADLALLADPALLPASLAGTFALTLAPDRDPIEALEVFLKPRRLLLLADNFEHLLETSPVIAQLLAAAPLLQVVATSRAPLGVRGEHVVTVDTLTAPDAAELFAVRAAQAGRTIPIEEAAVVGSIVARLDYLPLAIELAAARVRRSTLHSLDHDLAVGVLHLLAGGPRDAPARQQTLRAAIGWSVDLLDPNVRAAFQRLGIFAGGWTTDAAAAVIGDSAETKVVTQALDTLIDLHLLRWSAARDGEPRYTMLETVREYAVSALQEAGALAKASERHADYFLALAERAAPELWENEEHPWPDRLEAEMPNMRAALNWLLATARTSDQEAALKGARLALALQAFWEARGYEVEGTAAIRALLTLHSAPTIMRARLLSALANLTWEFDIDHAVAALQEAISIAQGIGDEHALAEFSVAACTIGWWHADCNTEEIVVTLDRCVAFYREAGNDRRLTWALIEAGWCYGDVHDPRGIELTREGLALARKTGDVRRVADGFNILARLEHFRHNFDSALEYARASVALCQRIGDREGLISPLNAVADAYQALGRYEDARAILEGSLEQTRIGSPQLKFVWTLNNLGEVILALGDLTRARELFAECLALSRTASGGGHTIAYSAIGLAGLAATAGRARDGARWLGSIAAWFMEEDEDWEQPKYFPPEHRLHLQRSVALVRGAIDQETFDAAFATGRTIPHEQVCDEVLAWAATIDD